MTNKDVFERYGNIQWVVEENMYFLLQQFSEKLGARPSFNPAIMLKEGKNGQTRHLS